MKEINTVIYSPYEPVQKNSLWIKPSLRSNTNQIYIYNNGWESVNIGGSGTGTSDYNELENLPSINGVVLKGNKSLKDLGIAIPNLDNYITEGDLEYALTPYAKTSEIPSINGLLSKEEAESIYQPKGDYALNSDIPDVSEFATKDELANKANISYVNSQLAARPTLSEVNTIVGNSISELQFKTINGQEITGVGDIQIEGSSIEVDNYFSDTSVNPVENKVITEKINQLEELLQKLDNKIFPTTLTVSGGGTYDEGTTQVVTVTWKLMKDGQVLTPDSVTINNEEVDPSVNYKVFTGVTSTTAYRVNVVYNGKEFTGSTVATFKKTYYRYYGAIPLDVTFDSITSDTITALTKEVCTSAGASNLSFPIPEEGRLTYAYPSRFGQLAQVQDMNLGGAPSTDWSTNGDVTTPNPRATITINNESYYVYCSINPNYEGTFKLSFIK